MNSNRTFISLEQRKAFGKWSEELNKLDKITQRQEAEMWIIAGMAILENKNIKESQCQSGVQSVITNPS